MDWRRYHGPRLPGGHRGRIIRSQRGTARKVSSYGRVLSWWGGGEMRRFALVAGLLALVAATTLSQMAGHAASSFATPQFQQQWEQGEAITPNFWGPLVTARDGQQEPYREAQGGQRLVQYFDKGRMELTNGKVTNGLLATEIIKGRIQTGDNTFQPQAPP